MVGALPGPPAVSVVEDGPFMSLPPYPKERRGPYNVSIFTTSGGGCQEKNQENCLINMLCKSDEASPIVNALTCW